MATNALTTTRSQFWGVAIEVPDSSRRIVLKRAPVAEHPALVPNDRQQPPA